MTVPGRSRKNKRAAGQGEGGPTRIVDHVAATIQPPPGASGGPASEASPVATDGSVT